MNYNFIQLNDDEINYITGLCPADQYRVLPTSLSIPGIAPRLVEKCNTMLVAASGDAHGNCLFMINLLRVDPRDPHGMAIDQMPVGCIVRSGESFPSGVIIQHGNWSGRTTVIPTGSIGGILSGHYETYSSLDTVPKSKEGHISELVPSSNYHAFTILNTKVLSVYKEYIKSLTSEIDYIETPQTEAGLQ